MLKVEEQTRVIKIPDSSLGNYVKLMQSVTEVRQLKELNVQHFVLSKLLEAVSKEECRKGNQTPLD